MTKTINFKEQMRVWLDKHPNATPEQIWEAGYMQCTDNWCHGKREQMEQLCETIKEILQ